MCGFNVGADLIRVISWKTELPKVRRSGAGKVLKEQRWDGGGEREAQVFPSGAAVLVALSSPSLRTSSTFIITELGQVVAPSLLGLPTDHSA